MGSSNKHLFLHLRYFFWLGTQCLRICGCNEYLFAIDPAVGRLICESVCIWRIPQYPILSDALTAMFFYLRSLLVYVNNENKFFRVLNWWLTRSAYQSVFFLTVSMDTTINPRVLPLLTNLFQNSQTIAVPTTLLPLDILCLLMLGQTYV